MLHTNNPIIKHKAGLLNLAEELGNVSRACKIMGVSRDTFYRYQELAAEGGIDALVNQNRRVPNLKLNVRLLFIRSQLMASLIMSVLYVLFFITVVFIGFQALPDDQTVILILKTICINLMMMISLTFMASFRVTFQTASTIYFVLITVCMVLGIVSLKYNDGLVYWINLINPIAIYSTLLQPDLELSFITIFVYSLMFIISLISALTFKTEPV